jgi:hypothetical protein
MPYFIYENGAYREATEAETAEIEARKADHKPCRPTSEERIAALEAAMLDMIMGG